MNTKPYTRVPVLLASVIALGCSQETPPPSEAVKHAASKKAVLTSTATAAPNAIATPAETTEAPAMKTVETATAEPTAPEIEKTPTFVPELEPADGLSIERLMTAPAVEHREPVAPSTIFGSHEEKIYAFLDVRNESDEARVLVVHFIGPDGFASGGIELSIPPNVPRWRTWAFTKHAKEPGLWRVDVRNLDGELLGALSFEVDHGC